MKSSPFFLLPIVLGVLLTACNLTQEVEIELPEYEPQIVVESYLRPGLPYLVTMVESTSFFDDVELDYVRDATVTISHEGTTDTLLPIEIDLNTPGLEGVLDTALLKTLEPIIGQGIYLYGALQLVPEVYNEPFELSIKTQDGRELSATTYIPEPVAQDSFKYRFNEDSLAIVLTQFTDIAGEVNFYRRVLEEREPRISENTDGTQDTTWVDDVEQEFILDDDLGDGEPFVFGTTFEYQAGDTLFSTIYHITPEYYRFLETRDAAITASFSPFAPPAVVSTNIEGGAGIFAGFTGERLMLVVGE
ncbi:MAG: DUF4249 domain-containing protein [Bacteroidota bacterium]